MSRTLTISDALYERLAAAAQLCGMGSVERLIEQWDWPGPEAHGTAGPIVRRDRTASDMPPPPGEEELRRRQEVVARIDELRERLFLKYGTMPDSAAMVREDRER